MSDLIDRQKALDGLEYEMKYGAVIDRCGLDTAYDIIENIQSAEPEERTVKIYDDKLHPVIHYCDNKTVALINKTWNYCPYCGAKLEWI